MTAHRLETTIPDNKSVTLENLPFAAGAAVEIIVLESPSKSEEASPSDAKNLFPLRGMQPYHYDDPFGPPVRQAIEYL